MIRVRIAPSPTGKLHLGTARTALFNFLFAKKNKGKFILRFEDTDRSRSTKEYEEDIINNLKWLGLFWDEGPYFQMDRLKIYQKYAQQLIKKGFAEKKEGAIVFKVKKALESLKIKYKIVPRLSKKSPDVKGEAYLIENIGTDLLHGPISGLVFDTVLLKSDGLPTFHLANVVDDVEMRITHIIRGDDHLPNTPFHIVLQKAFSFPTPFYLHLPLILSPDRKKMSKRYGAVAIDDYRKMGYLPEAMVNFLAFLGTSGHEKEIYSLPELIRLFDLKKLQKSPAIFFKEKLDWVNEKWIRRLSVKELTRRIHLFGYPKITEDMTKIIQERIKVLSDVPFWTDFFFKEIPYKKELLIQTLDKKTILKILNDWLNTENFKKDSLRQKAETLVQKYGLKMAEITYPLRIAITGSKISPPLFESMQILGKEECLRRIKKALSGLKTGEK